MADIDQLKKLYDKAMRLALKEWGTEKQQLAEEAFFSTAAMMGWDAGDDFEFCQWARTSNTVERLEEGYKRAMAWLTRKNPEGKMKRKSVKFLRGPAAVTAIRKHLKMVNETAWALHDNGYGVSPISVYHELKRKLKLDPSYDFAAGGEIRRILTKEGWTFPGRMANPTKRTTSRPTGEPGLTAEEKCRVCGDFHDWGWKDRSENYYCSKVCFEAGKAAGLGEKRSNPGVRPLSQAQIEKLVKEFSNPRGRFHSVGKWEFDYMYPGNFSYTMGLNGVRRVFFTPDWDTPGSVSVQVTTEDGEYIEGDDYPYTVPLTAEKLFKIVYPWLKKYAKQS